MRDKTIMSLFRMGFVSVMFIGGCSSEKLDPISEPDFFLFQGDTIRYRSDGFAKQVQQTDFEERKNFVGVGDTILRYQEVKLNVLPSEKPDLKNITASPDGIQPRYVSFGGNLSAGYRDGGYFNDGIETSFPNLLARQMGLFSFNQPKFSPENFNGYSRKVLTEFNPTNGPVPKVKYVVNNTAIENIESQIVRLKDHIKVPYSLNNFSVPDLYPGALKPNYPLDVLKETGSQSMKYTERLNPLSEEGKVSSIYDLARFNGIDFFTLEAFNLPDYPNVNGAISEDNFNPNYYEKDPLAYVAPEARILSKLKKDGVKYGVILNSPNFYKFPIMNVLKGDKRSIISDKTIYSIHGVFDGSDEEFLLLPTSEIDSLLSPAVSDRLKRGLSPNTPLINRSSVIKASTVDYLSNNYINGQNRQLEFFSQYYGYPILDLYSIYEKINSGQYVTHDGVRIDPSWPNGNFYSLDGIYPTSFGNAVIANEIIQLMNKQYNLKISFIPTTTLLEK